jgi:hypothetical protein
MSSNRASLLAGLRTGGVRSASNPHQIPQTAAPGGSFPRYPQSNFPAQSYNDADADDDLADQFANIHFGRSINGPMTAGVIGSNNPFQQQQQAQLMLIQAQIAMQNGLTVDQAQAMQMQMDMMRLQAIQHQQQQQMLLAQAQMNQQQQLQAASRRPNGALTAGPLQASFDLRSPAPGQLRPRNANRDSIDEVPMTAALGGKFGSRSISTSLNPNATSFTSRGGAVDELNGYHANGTTAPINTLTTSVISGGTSLGALNGHTTTHSLTPSKSDTAVSWRRGSTPAASVSVRSANKTPSPPRKMPSFVISPPNSDGSPPRSGSPEDFVPVPAPAAKTRPQPLRFPASLATSTAQQYTDPTDSAQVVVVGNPAEDDVSTPTPTSSSSSHSSKEREEAARRLYEGLGIGRPAPPQTPIVIPPTPLRQPSQPVRQPRGPPGGVEELGPKNFASRIRRKAIGGLENLLDARERRESTVVVEAF